MLRRSYAAGAVAAAFALSGTAFAADMPAPEPSPQPAPAPAPAPAFYDWTGVYGGITGGYAWGDYDVTDPDFGSRSFDGDGALLGGTIGSNWQVNNWVFGLEGDLSWADMSGSTNFAPDDPDVHMSADNDWLGTIRGRVGFALDEVLIYGTAGAAFTKANIDMSIDNAVHSDSNTHTGWTAGGGIEAALTEAVSAKVEYLYADFGSENFMLHDEVVSADYDAHIVRAGLNYRFSW